MKCAAVQHKLINFLEGQLSGEEKEMVQTHLQHCESCRTEQHMLKQTFDRIAYEKQAKPPAFLQDRIVQSMLQQGVKRQQAKRMYTLQRVAAVLLLFLGLVGGIVLGTTLYGSGETHSTGVIEEFYLGSDVGEFESFLLNK